MPNRFPAYPRKPHRTGQARIRISGRDVYLGVWDSPASRREYARLAKQHADRPDLPAAPRAHALTTVADVLARWILELPKIYKPKSPEPAEHRTACAVVDRIAGHVSAADFGVEHLAQVRDAMADGSWMDDEEKLVRTNAKQHVGWCKNRVNRQVIRVRTIWRWAEERGLVPRGSWAHLRSLRPLTGSSALARHTAPREPADWDVVKATLPFLTPVVAAIVEVQWWCGARPGEVCRMRAGEVDTAGEVWVYSIPADQHKTGHRDGVERVVPIGPEAQRTLLPWLEAARKIGPDAIVFPPSRRRSQKTYTRFSYRTAIHRACDEAGVPRWCPYQLRHAAKVRIVRACGLDAARAQLGQRSIGVTNGYAKQQDVKLASEAARKTG